MPSRSKELAPVIETERFRRFSPSIGYRALCLWYAELPSDPQVSGLVKTVQSTPEQELKASLRTSYSTVTGTRTASLTLSDALSPMNSVNIRGRMLSDNSVGPDYEEMDLIAHNELAWRINSVVDVDLIPKGVTFGAAYEPPIVKVRSAEPLSTAAAEARVLNTLRVMGESS